MDEKNSNKKSGTDDSEQPENFEISETVNDTSDNNESNSSIPVSKLKKNKKKTAKLVSDKSIKTFESESSLTKTESNNTDKTPKLLPEKSLKIVENESNISGKSNLKKHSNDEAQLQENLVKTESKKSLFKFRSHNRSKIYESTESVASFARQLLEDQNEEDRSADNEIETSTTRRAAKKLLQLVSDINLPAAETEDAIFPNDETDQYYNFIKNTVGEFGLFQFILLLLSFFARVTVSMHKQSIAYLQTPVNMTCAEYLNTSMDYHFKENIFMESSVCNNPNCTVIFDTSVYDKTMITEYKLICSRYFLSDLQHTILMFGGMCGNFVFGYLAAKYGRYSTFILSTIITSFFGLLTGLAPTVEVFTAFRFLCGFGVSGLSTGYLLLLETIGNKYRFIVSIFYQYGYASGVLLLAIFAYLIRNWRSWYIVISSPLAFLVLFYLMQFKESPRWLLIQGHVDKCILTLEDIAKFNNMPSEHIDYIVRDLHKKLQVAPDDSRYTTLFKSRLILRTITLCFAYAVHTLTAHGSSSYYRPMDESVFIFSFVLGISLIPGTLITFFLSKFLTLKHIAFYTAVVLMMTIESRFHWKHFESGNEKTRQVTLAIIYNFFQMIFQTTLMLLVVQLFPTTLRSQAQGLIQASANIGSMIAPYTLHLEKYNTVAPMLFFFFLWCFCISMIHFYLPDELEEGLPDTYSQIKHENRTCCEGLRKLNKIDVVR